MNYLLKTTFSGHFSVLPANDINSGISLLKTTKNIDLFLIDTDYETNESVDFIKFISSSVVYAKPIIVLLSNKEIIEKFDSKLELYFFLKPFNPAALVGEAKKLLQYSLR